MTFNFTINKINEKACCSPQPGPVHAWVLDAGYQAQASFPEDPPGRNSPTGVHALQSLKQRLGETRPGDLRGAGVL